MTQRRGKSGTFCAMFGDIVGSRSAVDRKELQNRIVALLEEINAGYEPDIVAAFKIIAGDEVRGLLRGQSRSYEIISRFEEAVQPHKMRFAVGIGEISTEISTDINLVDGPALHRASAAMAILKNRKRSRGRSILYSSNDPQKDRVLNALTFLVTSIKYDWTQQQRRAIAQIRRGSTFEEAGENLGVSQPSMTHLLRRASYYPVVEAEALISSELSARASETSRADNSAEEL